MVAANIKPFQVMYLLAQSYNHQKATLDQRTFKNEISLDPNTAQLLY